MYELLKRFSPNQNFVPWGLSTLAPGLYTCIKLKFSNVFTETTWAIFTRFHGVEGRVGRVGGGGGGGGASVERVLTVCSNGCMQLNKMASMPIYGEKASPEPRMLYGWILVYSFEDTNSTQFVQLTILLTLTFLEQG